LFFLVEFFFCLFLSFFLLIVFNFVFFFLQSLKQKKTNKKKQSTKKKTNKQTKKTNKKTKKTKKYFPKKKNKQKKEMLRMSNIIYYRQPNQEYYLKQFQKANAQAKTVNSKRSSLFQGMMIERIQNIRPGCGSCGH